MPAVAVESAQSRSPRQRFWLTRAASGQLTLIGAAYALVQVVLGTARIGFGWDETVYLSQVAPHVPAAYWSAPRARGVTLLAAPVAGFTTSTAAIRAYLVVLGALALVLAFRVWLRILPSAVVVLAAGLFASMWLSVLYGNEVMPNYWIAVLTVAATGFAIVGVRTGSRRSYFGLALCIAATALLRPSDALWFAAPILVGAIAVRSWRRTSLGWVTLTALVVGIAPWVIEAYARYGGLVQRLRMSSHTEGGLAPHPGFVYQARALYGPLLCRPCTHAHHALVYDVWWVLLPFVVVLALAVARRSAAFVPLLLATACGATIAAPYLFLVGYAAPRFLLPMYALFALPVADLLIRVGRRTWRNTGVPAVLVAAGIALFLIGQLAVVSRQTGGQRAVRADYVRIADQLRTLGITPPCVLGGENAPPIAFHAACSSQPPFGKHRPRSEAGWIAYAHRAHYGVIVYGNVRAHSYASTWPLVRFQHVHGFWAVYLPPASPSGRPGAPS